MNPNTFSEICESNKLIKLSISKYSTYMLDTKLEGLEFQLGLVKSFWIKDGERNYDEPPSDRMKAILDKITEPKNIRDTNETDNNIIMSDNTQLPEFLTKELMKKWEDMRTIDRMLMFQKTPRDKIKSVAVGKNARGEMEYAPYVEGNYMIREANACFLFDWRFIHIGMNISDKAVCVYGTLEANVDGKTMSRPAVGYETINAKMTAQLAIKSATTDAIKKGLSLFGFNSDVYGGDI